MPRPKDNFRGVDCVTIDGPAQKSKYDDRNHYVHVWVDGDQKNPRNKRYLMVADDQINFVNANQGKVLKPIDWQEKDKHTWLAPTSENTQVFAEAAPDNSQFIQDDVNSTYPAEPSSELDETRAFLQDIVQLIQDFPTLSEETIFKARCSIIIGNQK